ncbi:MAG: DUF4126 domain-containing protein [Verrucomicrobia bacterium]|nr:DUF4126 domain-containing protein [Verrucomicrobiota bacterium]
METLLSLCIGLGLSAACGFRVFIPLLGLSLAAHAGHVTLASDFQWLASTPALIALTVATALEITGYYVPWLDNFLDTIATPSAVVAGVMTTAAMTTDMSPFLRWSLAVVAGGGAAALVQGATVSARAASTLLTGGLANPAVATAELVGSTLTASMAVFAPVIALMMLSLAAIAFHRWWRNRQQTLATSSLTDGGHPTSQTAQQS